jgi:predicted amidophosphoribosyltransferase
MIATQQMEERRPVPVIPEDCLRRDFNHARLVREWKTVVAMIRIYCQGQHGSGGALCQECAQLVEYAGVRLERCRFGAAKPTCAKCPVHCYQRTRREQIKAVMRYAGPHMLWRHPRLALHHWLDGLRRAVAD